MRKITKITSFANKPAGNTTVTCKNCGNTCYLGEAGNFCPKCGKPITAIPKKKTLTSSDFTNLYNYFYNREQDIFSDQSKRIFEFYIKNLYSQIEAETLPIINSSLRSGYSIRLAEEKIYNKSISPLINIGTILKKARKNLIGTDININILDEKNGNLLALAIYLTVENKFESHYLEKKIIKNHPLSIIQDNVDYLTPALKEVYEGKTILNTLGGIMPHVFTKPIKFDVTLQNLWNSYITSDTIFGYCLKLAESYLTENIK